MKDAYMYYGLVIGAWIVALTDLFGGASWLAAVSVVLGCIGYAIIDKLWRICGEQMARHGP